jgi:hypothetical protein
VGVAGGIGVGIGVGVGVCAEDHEG